MDADELKRQISKETMYTIESILNYASVAIHPDRYPPFRAKILSLGNDTWRNLHEWIDKEREHGDRVKR